MAQTSKESPSATALIPCNDRSLLLPSHSGRNVFPNSPLFSRLLRHAHRNWTAIRDLRLGVEKTYGQLLSDVLGLRQVLQHSLDSNTTKALEKGEEIYIGVLAGGGYEFTVGILAVLAIGAAAVPMCMQLCFLSYSTILFLTRHSCRSSSRGSGIFRFQIEPSSHFDSIQCGQTWYINCSVRQQEA